MNSRILILCTVLLLTISCGNKKEYAVSFDDLRNNSKVAKISQSTIDFIKSSNEPLRNPNSSMTIDETLLGLSPEMLIEKLQCQGISDLFIPCHYTVVPLRIGINTYDSGVEFYFQNDRLCLITITMLNNETVLYDLFRVFGKTYFKISPKKDNQYYKYLWAGSDAIAMFSPGERDELVVISIGEIYEGEVSSQCSLQLADALKYAYSLKQEPVSVRGRSNDFHFDEEPDLFSFDGNLLKEIIRSGIHVISNEQWKADDNTHSFFSTYKGASGTTNNLLRDHFLELRFWQRRGSYTSSSSNSNDAEILKSIQREKVMREAGFDKQADQERNNRWNNSY